MKEEFAFLFPPPRTVRFNGGTLDIRSACFPLEVFRKFDFLFARFGVRNRARGLQVIVQEPPFRSPAKGSGPGSEEYAIDCMPDGVCVSAATTRGQFYALSSLLQILSFYAAAGAMPAFALRDAPETAFRGACFFRAEATTAAADPPALQRLFLDLALLKFNCLALPGDAATGEWSALAALAQRTGIEVLSLDPDPDALSRLAPAGNRPASPLRAASGAAWFDFFLESCRAAKPGSGVTVAWSDHFLSRPEWIRKIPRDVLVLNRGAEAGRGDWLRTAVQTFKEHHVRQVLCPSLSGGGRILPAGRAAMDRIDAACAAAAAARLAGVLLVHGERQGVSCLPQGSALARFQAGCRLWSGRQSTPAAFAHWVLGGDEPDLFRVCSLLAQAENRLPYVHDRYLFEDPLLAPFSRQGDPRQVVAHYRKAAQYLKKREMAPGSLSGFLAFVSGLFEIIAAKVEFSSRLAVLLEGEGGAETLTLQAASLQQAVAGLKGLYQGLLTAPPGDMLKGFDFLCERFAQLGRAAASPDSRRGLLSVLKSDTRLEAQATPPEGRCLP